MQIRISLIPALGLNGVALVGVCSLVRITREEDGAVAQETKVIHIKPQQERWWGRNDKKIKPKHTRNVNCHVAAVVADMHSGRMSNSRWLTLCFDWHNLHQKPNPHFLCHNSVSAETWYTHSWNSFPWCIRKRPNWKILPFNKWPCLFFFFPWSPENE